MDGIESRSLVSDAHHVEATSKLYQQGLLAEIPRQPPPRHYRTAHTNLEEGREGSSISHKRHWIQLQLEARASPTSSDPQMRRRKRQDRTQ